MRRNPHGFTLIELVLVILIAGVMAALAVPRFANSMSSYQAQMAARRLAVDLEMARSLARARSADITVRFTTATHRYELVGLTLPDNPSKPYVVVLNNDPYKSQITALSLPGASPASSLVFDGYGKPKLTGNGSVTVRSGGKTHTLTIDAGSGRVTW